VIPTTLISLNFSRDLIRSTYVLNESMTEDLEFIKESNDATLRGMNDNALAIGIAEQADELMVFIEGMKNGVKNNEKPEGFEVDRLADMVNEFEKELLSLSTDANYGSIISQTLANPLKTKLLPYEEPVILLHNLIFFQLNVRLAEQTALRQLQQAETVALQALNR